MVRATAIDIILASIEDEFDLILELESRGYVTLGAEHVDSIKYDLDRNELRECLIQIERYIPEVKGLVSLLDKLTNNN